MAWRQDIYEFYDPNVFHVSPLCAAQQPTTVLQQQQQQQQQQLPDATTMMMMMMMMPPGSAPSIRPGGHVKEDLVELMMIQNAQMHQVIMNNMSVSALRSFGYSDPTTPGPETPRDLFLIEENEAEPKIYHHYYPSGPFLACPSWLLPQATPLHQHGANKPTSAPPYGDRCDVSLPPSSSSQPRNTGSAGVADVPAAENKAAAEKDTEKKRL